MCFLYSRIMDLIPSPGDSLTKRNSVHEHSRSMSVSNGKNRQNSPGRPPYVADPHSRGL